MACSDRLDILLATYNGARHIQCQIDSILSQAPPNSRLLIRDDGSTDATLAILSRYAARWPRTIVLIQGKSPLGPCGNFSALLEHTDASHIMFSDQDNAWLPERVSRLLGRVKQVEADLGQDHPILIHSDLTVVDDSLRVLDHSFWHYQHLDPVRGRTLNRLLIQNVVTGCAAIINRALVQKAVPIPIGAVMHDWWLALAAATFGRLEHLPDNGILFRQHGANQIGAVRWDLAHVIRKALTFWDRSLLVAGMQKTQRQAKAFLDRFAPELSPEQCETIQAFIALGENGFWHRRLLLLRHGFYRTGWLRNLGLLARV